MISCERIRGLDACDGDKKLLNHRQNDASGCGAGLARHHRTPALGQARDQA